MNNISYTYDPQAAHDADTGAGNKYLSETGAYVGKIIKVTGKKTKKGGDSINIAFEAVDGRKADYLTLQMCSATGEKYFGYGVFMAMLRCAVVKIAESKSLPDGTLEFPGLEQKPIGLVLQATEYLKAVKDKDGRQTGEEVATRPELIAAFSAKTRQMAIEIDKQTPAAILDKMLATLQAVRPLKKAARTVTAPTANSPAPAGQFNDDDIPW